MSRTYAALKRLVALVPTSWKYAALGVFGLGAVAVAQVYTPPIVTNTHQSADLIQVIPNGAPVVGNVYATIAQVTNVYGFYKSVPVTGFTYTFGTNVTFAAFNPAGVLATAYITAAPNPSDGAKNCFTSTQTISGVSFVANTTLFSQVVNNGNLAAVANTPVCFLYSASNLTWDRD